MKYVVIVSVLYVIYYLWKNRKIKNSNKLPQEVSLTDYDNPKNNPKFKGLQKGNKLKLIRKLGNHGYHLYVTIQITKEDTRSIEKIIFSWSDWSKRIYNFNYYPTNENVKIENNIIEIDIGSFNNCEGSRNFLKRTSKSKFLRVELLDFLPDHNDFEYEKDLKHQSIFLLETSLKEINKFKKGLHYLDS